MKRFLRTAFLALLSLAVLSMFTVGPIMRWLYPIPYAEVISKEAARRGQDPFLVTAIIQTESGFRPLVVSPKGARGLMQLMPDTAAWIAEQMGMEFSEADLFRPEINIALGSWYLNYLHNQFPTSAAALAAYNAGQGNVRRWLETKVWDGGLENLADIPFPETRSYIGRVLRTRDFYRRIYDNRWETYLP